MDGVQAEVAPAQVSRRKIPPEEENAPRFVAADAKVMKRPVALMVAEVLAPLAWVPSAATETRCVEGTQPDGAPAQVSRTNTSLTPFVSLATRLLAEDRNVTKRPSALIAGEILAPSEGLLLNPIDTSVSEGVQPDGAPRQVSRTKTFCVLPGISLTPSVEARTCTA